MSVTKTGPFFSKFFQIILLAFEVIHENHGIKKFEFFPDAFNFSNIEAFVDDVVDNANKTATSINEEVEAGEKYVEKKVNQTAISVTDQVEDSVNNVATEVNQTATSLEKGVKEGVSNVTHEVKNVAKNVYNGTTRLSRKANKVVFDIVKGFVNGVSEVVGTPVNLKQITFYLVTVDNLEHPSKIDFYNPNNVADTEGKIYFLIHGWNANMNSSWYYNISDSLTRKNSNTHVVQVNWDGPANDNYAFSAFDTESAGNFVGILINKLVAEYEVPAENFVLIGHSLGAQICGFAAKKFKQMSGIKLPRIIALDPAGPLFILRPNSKKLNRNDADVVMTVHTDADKLGYPTTVGTIDFYPNGGDNQPGCWAMDIGNVSTYTEPVTCDHSRAWDYFTEAVEITGSFPARKCSNYNDFQNNKCENKIVDMGDLETSSKGSFYLYTGSRSPYSIPLPNVKSKQQHMKDKKNFTQ